MLDEAWDEWLRNSPLGSELRIWCQEAPERMRRVGRDAYRERLAALLSAASARDCAAAGLGCTRRLDRVCREPLVCRLDSSEPSAAEEVPRFEREGPVPGACGGFHGFWTDFEVHVWFAGRGDRHRAVFWHDMAASAVRLWVDGAVVGAGAFLDSYGHWLGGRFLVVQAAGPDDHPRQTYGPGLLCTGIVSVLIHDVAHGSTRTLVPGPHETWTDPRVVLSGGTLRVYATPEALSADVPDRILPAESPSE
ncbi:hypothetical protein [Streptomyces spongiae]|uniref:Uncharacterized protein n=1 Tax=Streptomyces spongiae TaxID=565072 RepID=A0A5N8XVB8_9ACTN|nr:hypothetical protein [Streptomyces spongiae]MPY63323.1 hypothetical protein [Streptomyces spongiae]